MTPLEIKALDFVRERIAVVGFAPTLREIRAHLGTRSMSRVHDVVSSLVDSGHLVRRAHQRRGLDIAQLPDMRAVPSDVLMAELARRGVTPGAFAKPARRAFDRGDVPCAASCCSITVEPGNAFCREHWYAIDPHVRNELLNAHAAYRRRQCPSNERRYQEAFQAAQEQADRLGREAA